MRPAMKEMVWGGKLLQERFGKQIPSDTTGEAWEVAAHPHGQSTVAEGALEGTELQTLVDQYQEALVGTKVYAAYGNYFPLLIKFIDANQNLSVQVHPNDAQAVELEGPGASGKTEMWYVLDAKPGARLVYGFNQDLTAEELKNALEQGTLESFLNWVDVHPGDTFYIPAGTLHAIGSGILIAEIQQNSDLTYRVYDYNRLGLDGKPRQLHVEKAVAVVDRKAPIGREKADIDQGVISPFFETYRRTVDGTWTLQVSPERFEILICVGGTGTLTCGTQTLSVQEGDSFLIPATAGTVVAEGQMQLLQTHVK